MEVPELALALCEFADVAVVLTQPAEVGRGRAFESLSPCLTRHKGVWISPYAVLLRPSIVTEFPIQSQRRCREATSGPKERDSHTNYDTTHNRRRTKRTRDMTDWHTTGARHTPRTLRARHTKRAYST